MALTQFSGSSGTIPNLNSYLLQLFGIRELFTTPAYTQGANTFSAYTGANAKFTVDSDYRLQFNAGGISIPASSPGVNLAGASGELQVGYSNAAVTSTADAFVVWAGASFPLNNFLVAGSLGFVARNTSGAGIFWSTQNNTRVVLDYSGNLLQVSSGGIGYGTGSGGAVTQATSKSTGVTLNKSNGQITMNGAALAAGAVVSFTLTNSLIASTDKPDVVIASGATAGAYTAQVDAVASGSCRVSVRNQSGGSLSEAIVLNFVLLKAVTS